MNNPEQFFEDLIELGCPHEFVFGNAKEGYAWIVGRLSAYNIEPQGESVEELVFLLKGARNLIPHVDTSLIKRDQSKKVAKKGKKKYNPIEDPDVLSGIEKFVEEVLQPYSADYLLISTKSKGFRVYIERNSVEYTIFNIDYMRGGEDGSDILCTASYLPLDMEDLVDFKLEGMPKETTQGNSPIPAFNSVKLTDALDFIAQPEVIKKAISTAVHHLIVMNKKYNQSKDDK